MKRARMCETKFLGPTDHRGERVKARHVNTGRSVTVPWDHELDTETNHLRAARELLSEEPTFRCATEGGGFFFGIITD